MAAASKITKAVAAAVSESPTVRAFDNGEIVAEVVREVWMVRGYSPFPRGTMVERFRDPGARDAP